MVESEAPVSSFMEFPREIMSGVVLLGSPSGKIVIQIISFSPPPLASSFNKPVEKYGDVMYNRVAQEALDLGDPSLGMDEEICADHSNEDTGLSDATANACQNITSDVREFIVLGLQAIGTGSLHGMKRKRATQVKFDLIPPIGPECKRARSKRCKVSTFSRKEVDTCKLNVLGVPAIGNRHNAAMI